MHVITIFICGLFIPALCSLATQTLLLYAIIHRLTHSVNEQAVIDCVLDIIKQRTVTLKTNDISEYLKLKALN